MLPVPEEAKRISVQILTESPQTRARLRNIVSAAPGLELRDGSVGRDGAPDVVILDPAPVGDASPRDPALTPSSRTLVLTDRASEEWVRELLGTHSASVIGRSAQPAEIIAAIEAMAAGLVVFSPDVLAGAAPQVHPVPTSPPGALQDPLTPRESDVLRMLADGLSNKEIARQLHLSEHTVKYHLSSVFGKLGVSSRTEAVMAGIQRGIILI